MVVVIRELCHSFDYFPDSHENMFAKQIQMNTNKQ